LFGLRPNKTKNNSRAQKVLLAAAGGDNYVYFFSRNINLSDVKYGIKSWIYRTQKLLKSASKVFTK
jgi:hypothetical protein